MMKCDCAERIGIEINSYKFFIELKEFFEEQAQKGIFEDVPVEEPYYIGYIGALLIVVAAIATPIAKTQTAREVWFFVMAGGAVMKILTVEISRIIIRLR